MKALYLSLILCCLGVHSSSAVEKLIDKKVGKWWVGVWEDEFTKNKIAGIGNLVTDKAVPRAAIGPAQNDLSAKGKLVPAPLFKFYGSYPAGGEIGRKTTILGILVDGVSMTLKGETWKKDLIAAMLKGEKLVIRFQESSSKGPRIGTVSTSLDGFAECWAAIPKDLIDLKEASGINDTKNPPTPKRDTPLPKFKPPIAKNRTWTSSDGSKTFEGVLIAYKPNGGQVTIKRKTDGRDFKMRRDRLSTNDQSYIAAFIAATEVFSKQKN
jgi:hypothetical protein